VHILGPRGARLVDERSEHSLIAGQRAGMRGRRGRARRGRADLQHGDADVSLRGSRERARQAGTVAVGLEEQRDGADVLVLDQGLEQRGRVEHRLVADRCDRGSAARAPARAR
jgi:hypothetical protein